MIHDGNLSLSLSRCYLNPESFETDWTNRIDRIRSFLLALEILSFRWRFLSVPFSLGMEHDGNQDGNSCDHDNFVMSPTLGAGKTSWSSCSRDYLEKFIQQPQASCVLTPTSSVNILSQFTPDGGKLPGQIFDANQQCALRFGVDSRKSHLQQDDEICRLLRCDTGTQRNIVAYHAHPALEGTQCGEGKVGHHHHHHQHHLHHHWSSSLC